MTKPDNTNLTNNVWAVYYPDNSGVVDVTELVPNIIAWADSTSLSIGNWTSIAEKKKELEKLNIKKPLILKEINIEEMNEQPGELFCVGFDILQIPKFTVQFNCKTE